MVRIIAIHHDYKSYLAEPITAVCGRGGGAPLFRLEASLEDIEWKRAGNSFSDSIIIEDKVITFAEAEPIKKIGGVKLIGLFTEGESAYDVFLHDAEAEVVLGCDGFNLVITCKELKFFAAP